MYSLWTFAIMALIFGELLLLLAINHYFEMRWEKHKKTKTKDFPFYEAVWTKSKIVYTVYPDHLEIFFPSSRIEIQEKQKTKNRA